MAADKIPPDTEETEDPKKKAYREDVERRAVRIAFDIIGPVFRKDDYGVPDVAKAVVRAVAAVAKLTLQASLEWKPVAEDEDLYFEAVQIVASVTWAASVSMDKDDIEGLHPYCQPGNAFIGFAHAMDVLQRCEDLQYAGERIAEGMYVGAEQSSKALRFLNERSSESTNGGEADE